MTSSDQDSGIACVIPTHGRPDYLREAVQSVLNQSFLPSEILVVSDDGDPGTASVVAELASSALMPVRYLERLGQPGASESRNYGVTHSSAHLLAFLDDDDVWEPDFLLASSDALHSTKADFTAATAFRFGVGGRVPIAAPARNLTPLQAYLGTPGITGSTVLIRRNVFDEVGGYDAALPVMNDTDLVIRLLQAGATYAVLDAALVGRRRHTAGQLTDNSPRRFSGGWLFIHKHERAFPRALSRPRKAYQYRILWRMRGPVIQRARAAIGWAWHTALSGGKRMA